MVNRDVALSNFTETALLTAMIGVAWAFDERLAEWSLEHEPEITQQLGEKIC